MTPNFYHLAICRHLARSYAYALHMRMMRHRRAPSVQHRRDTDLCTEMLWIGGDSLHRLCRRLEQKVIDHPFVLIGDIRDCCRQCEDNMEVAHGKQLGLARFQPLPCRRPLTLGTMPVTAGVISDVNVAARIVLATRNMTASCFACLRHDVLPFGSSRSHSSLSTD